VAMMILAISLTVVLQLFSDGLRSGQVAKDYLRGVYHARAKMEEVLVMDEIVEGVQTGNIAGEGYSWTTFVKQQKDDPPGENRTGLALFDVTVTVRWQEGEHRKTFVLQSLRLGTAASVDE